MNRNMALDEISREKNKRDNTVNITFDDTCLMLNVGRNKYCVTLNEIEEREEPNESR